MLGLWNGFHDVMPPLPGVAVENPAPQTMPVSSEEVPLAFYHSPFSSLCAEHRRVISHCQADPVFYTFNRASFSF